MKSIQDAILQKHLHQLSLSISLQTILIYNGYNSLEKLVTLHISEWLTLKGMNYHLYRELLDFMHYYCMLDYIKET